MYSRGMSERVDAQIGRRTRTILLNGWQITQVEQCGGGWGNIDIRRAPRG